MKGIRLSLLALFCVLLFSGCMIHSKTQTETAADLPDNWESMVKNKLASLTPYGSPDDVTLKDRPEPCSFDFETRQYGYCGKADVKSGMSKCYFISKSNAVWLITINGLESLP